MVEVSIIIAILAAGVIWVCASILVPLFKEDAEIRRIGKRLGLTREEVLRELRKERWREVARRFREDRQNR